jgi:DNA invertase Pin-like site-specific DNA recombinase
LIDLNLRAKYDQVCQNVWIISEKAIRSSCGNQIAWWPAKGTNSYEKALVFEALQNCNHTVKGIARAVGVGVATVYRYQKELKEQGKISWAK